MTLRPALAIVGIVVAVEVVMVLTDTGPDLVLVAALIVTACTIVWAAVEVQSRVSDADPPPVAYRPPPSARPDQRVRALRNGLVLGAGNEHLENRLRDGLVELVDDQLLTEHGIDRHSDPVAAKRVIGRELFAFVDDPDSARAVSRPKKLAHIVTLIEQM